MSLDSDTSPGLLSGQGDCSPGKAHASLSLNWQEYDLVDKMMGQYQGIQISNPVCATDDPAALRQVTSPGCASVSPSTKRRH